MKKVIATVGTSIFLNYLDEHTDVRVDYDYIKKRRSREWDACKKRIERIKRSVTEWVVNAGDGASAEIKSLLKLHKKEKDHLEVYLLATDTVESRLAAEIIKDVFDRDVFGIGQQVKVFFNEHYDVIRGLQVENYHEFVREGAHNFVKRIHQLAGHSFADTIFNISGGYKGLIPFMTVMAQVNRCDIVYIYEESETLISLPKAPIIVDTEFMEKSYNELVMLDHGIENYDEAKANNYQKFLELEEKGFVEFLEDFAFLSPIGQVFLENFQSQNFVFYCSDEVWNEIQRQPDIQRILSEKFHSKKLRENKTEMKKVHTVYDDGNNDNRIYYFEADKLIYIYKTFENEEAAKEFIDSSLDKERIVKSSKPRKWRITHV